MPDPRTDAPGQNQPAQNKSPDGPKGPRRTEFDRAGKALVRRWQSLQRNPKNEARKESFNVGIARLLAAARALPDDPERRKGGADYRAGATNEPSVSIRLFGVAYEYQRNPADQALMGQLVNLAIAHYQARDGEKNADRDATRAATKKAKQARDEKRGGRPGRPRMQTRPGDWIPPNEDPRMIEAIRPRSHADAEERT